jgi:hypothetical protein
MSTAPGGPTVLNVLDAVGSNRVPGAVHDVHPALVTHKSHPTPIPPRYSEPPACTTTRTHNARPQYKNQRLTRFCNGTSDELRVYRLSNASGLLPSTSVPRRCLCIIATAPLGSCDRPGMAKMVRHVRYTEQTADYQMQVQIV